MRTIEVYKTNVNEPSSARAILEDIIRTHPKSDPIFDLENCDNVLRIEGSSGVDRSKIEKNH